MRGTLLNKITIQCWNQLVDSKMCVCMPRTTWKRAHDRNWRGKRKDNRDTAGNGNRNQNKKPEIYTLKNNSKICIGFILKFLDLQLWLQCKRKKSRAKWQIFDHETNFFCELKLWYRFVKINITSVNLNIIFSSCVHNTHSLKQSLASRWMWPDRRNEGKCDKWKNHRAK